MSGFTEVGLFLVSVLFGLITLSLWLRITLRYFKISTLNQFCHLIHTITNPLVFPINLAIKHNPKTRYDWSSLIALIVIEFIKIICLSLLYFHHVIPIHYLIIYVLADLIIQPCNILFYAIIIRLVMDFMNNNLQHPAADFIKLLTQPLFIFGRRLVPNISGFDFAPFIMMIILKVITLFILSALPWRLL